MPICRVGFIDLIWGDRGELASIAGRITQGYPATRSNREEPVNLSED